ncbi:MAG TPA: dual specificity protein phosphatase [Anaerolineaceae bacterium]
MIKKNFRILFDRLIQQGLKTTFLWAYARGWTILTGIPLLQYSRVTPNLFVGSQIKQKGISTLVKEGIDAVVNMRLEYDDQKYLQLPGKYCYIPTVDDTPPSFEQLDAGVTFIKQVHEEGGKVYIHCGAGIGRAPTMAAAYLINLGYSYDEAISLIKKVRPFIFLKTSQVSQLLKYQDYIRSNRERKLA